MKISRSAGGVALVELAVALPVLIAVLVGVADLARVFYYSIEVTAAARAGAQYAAFSTGHATQTANIRAAAQSAAPNIGIVAANVTPGAPVCVCAANDGSGQPWSTVSCSSSCGTGHLMETVTVTVTRTFTTLARIPGIPSTLTLSRSVTMRVSL